MRNFSRGLLVVVFLIYIFSVIGMGVGPVVNVNAYADRYQAGSNYFADGECDGTADYGVGTIYLDVDITVYAQILGFWYTDRDSCGVSGVGGVSCTVTAGVTSNQYISSMQTDCIARARDDEGSSTATDVAYD